MNEINLNSDFNEIKVVGHAVDYLFSGKGPKMDYVKFKLLNISTSKYNQNDFGKCLDLQIVGFGEIAIKAKNEIQKGARICVTGRLGWSFFKNKKTPDKLSRVLQVVMHDYKIVPFETDFSEEKNQKELFEEKIGDTDIPF